MPYCGHWFLVYRSRISRKEEPHFPPFFSWWMSGTRRITDYGLVWPFHLQYQWNSITQIHFTSFRVLIERIAIVEKWRRTGHHIISISQLSFRNWDKSLTNASFEKLLNQNLKSRPELRLAIQGKLSLNYVSKLAFSFLLRLLTHK